MNAYVVIEDHDNEARIDSIHATFERAVAAAKKLADSVKLEKIDDGIWYDANECVGIEMHKLFKRI
jgi:prophage tail gpP-like protein